MTGGARGRHRAMMMVGAARWQRYGCVRSVKSDRASVSLDEDNATPASSLWIDRKRRLTNQLTHGLIASGRRRIHGRPVAGCGFVGASLTGAGFSSGWRVGASTMIRALGAAAITGILARWRDAGVADVLEPCGTSSAAETVVCCPLRGASSRPCPRASSRSRRRSSVGEGAERPHAATPTSAAAPMINLACACMVPPTPPSRKGAREVAAALVTVGASRASILYWSASSG